MVRAGRLRSEELGFEEICETCDITIKVFLIGEIEIGLLIGLGTITGLLTPCKLGKAKSLK